MTNSNDTDIKAQTLPLNFLQANPFQPRDKIKKEDLEELVTSIKSYGILEPIVVAQTPAGYQIIAGERRWRAAKVAGLKEVPVVVRKTSPRGMLEMAIVENVQRIDLNPIERAQAFQQLIREFGFTTQAIAEKIGKSNPYVSNTLKLLELPDAITDGLLGLQITEGHARALSTIKDKDLMVECYKVVLKENASVRRAEDLARYYRDRIDLPAIPMRGKPEFRQDVIIKEYEEKFKHAFTRPSTFKMMRSRNLTKVTIVLKGSPEATQTDLNKILSIADGGTAEKSSTDK